MIAPEAHDPFDVFDPWTDPVDELRSPRPADEPRSEAPPRRPPAGPTFEPAGPRLPPPPAPPRLPDVRFTSTGAVEPGMVVPAAAPEAKRPRWSEGRPPRTPGGAKPPPDPAAQPAEFLRKVVVPQFQNLARRLEASQHYTTVQDLLDLPTPAVRVLIWPRPGLLDQSGARILATFELMLDRSATARVRTSYWLGARPEHVIPMAEIAVDRLGGAWVETQILDFVQKVLDRM